MCEHNDFVAKIDVNRILNGQGQISSFQADIHIWCAECELPFQKGELGELLFQAAKRQALTKQPALTKAHEAIGVVSQVEAVLAHLLGELAAIRTYEEQHYLDKQDNVERCVAMVDEQVSEAWIHAGRAYKRLIALRGPEIAQELEKLHHQAQD